MTEVTEVKKDPRGGPGRGQGRHPKDKVAGKRKRKEISFHATQFAVTQLIAKHDGVSMATIIEDALRPYIEARGGLDFWLQQKEFK